MTTPRLFISYSSQYQQDVDALAQFLQARGADIWLDHTKLTPGTANWQEAIDAGIQQATHVVYAASPAANSSNYVHAELQLAAYYQKPVIPYWLDGDAWIKCAPMEMSRTQFIDARHGKRAEAQERLAQTLGLAHQPVGGTVIAATPLPQPPPQAVPSFVPPSLRQLGYQGRVVNGVQVMTPPVITIPAKAFLMGSDKRKDPQADDDETPQQTVTLGAYGIAQYPLTVAEYACVVGQTVQGNKIAEPPTKYNVSWQQQLQHPDHPVVNISWNDSLRYSQWLATVTGQQWRLPSEAEWEKAARGPDGRLYPYGNTFDANKANTSEGKKGPTTPVGSYPQGASPYGLLDCSGNVWEWTSSIFKDYPYQANDGRENLTATENRVLRGGSWNDVSRSTRSAFRNYFVRVDYLSYFIGVRLAVSLAG